MIDDDFDKLVRYVFEHMFKGMSLDSEDGSMMRFRTDGAESSPSLMPEPGTPEIHTETVELDDRIVMVVDGIPGDANPLVRVTGKSVRIERLDVRSDLVFELPFDVEPDGSNASFKNGVLEMQFAKTTNTRTSSNQEFTLLG